MCNEPEEPVALEEMLQARERRALRQQRLLQAHGQTLLCLTMNIAGPIKTNQLVCKGFLAGFTALKEIFTQKNISILQEQTFFEKTGPEGYMVLGENAPDIKRITVQMEQEHPLGRLFDVDVLTKTGEPVSRVSIGALERACLICGAGGRACARSRAHTIQELQDKTQSMLKSYFEKHTENT